MTELSLLLPGLWLICVVGGLVVGADRGRVVEGLVLGLLGPIGVLVAVGMPRTAREEAKRQLEVEREKTLITHERLRKAAERERKLAEQNAPEQEIECERVVKCPVCGLDNVAAAGQHALHCKNCGELLSAKAGAKKA